MVSTDWTWSELACRQPRAAAASFFALVAAAWLGAGASLAQSPDSDAAAAEPAEAVGTIVPVHDEPHHRQVFQYGPMRILDLQLPPNDRSWYHSHEWPVLYMTLSTSAVRMQTLGSDPPEPGRGGRGGTAGRGGAPGGRAGGAGPRAGGPPPRPDAPVRTAPPAPRATSTTSYVEAPITHRIENVGEGLFRAMAVINESAGDASTSVEAAGFDAEPELVNPWFRAYRVTLNPGESTAIHRHHAAVVIFQATDGTGDADGPMRFEFNEPGQWAFFDQEREHVIRNTGENALQLLEIEVRRQQP